MTFNTKDDLFHEVRLDSLTMIWWELFSLHDPIIVMESILD